MRRLLVPGVVLVAVFLIPSIAMAHPLGNYSVNQHVSVFADGKDITVTYVVDMAEIPAFQERSAIDADSSGDVSDEEGAAYAPGACSQRMSGLTLEGERGAIPLSPDEAHVSFPSGQGGLYTLRLECVAVVEATGDFSLRNQNFPGRLGWKEMVVGGAARSDAPDSSPSDVLVNYPANQPLLDVTSVEFTTDGSPAASGAAPVKAAATPVTAVPAIVARAFDPDSGSVAVVVAMLGAFVLGLGHAAAPGHGKALMGAYLVGTRGNWRQATALGATVAVTHTVGVAALGLVTALASASFQPEAVYPFLSVAAGVAVLSVGIALAVRAWKARSAGDVGHHHGHSHGDHAHHHGEQEHHDHHDHQHEDALNRGHKHPERLTTGSFAALGLSGGLVPSASAVVLFLGALAVGKPLIGVVMVVLFGIGMAVTLVGAGLLVIYAEGKGRDLLANRNWLGRFWTILAPAAVLVVIGFGLVMIVSSIRDLL